MGAKANILIVEDESAVRETLKIILENDGYNVMEAEKGKDAVQLINNNTFDIILIDYNLPELNGLEVIKQSNAASKHLISVLITGVRSLEVAIEGMRYGTRDYLVKPIVPEELLKTLDKIIKERDTFNIGKEKLRKIAQEIKPDEKKELIYVVPRSASKQGNAKFQKAGYIQAITKLFKKSDK